MPKLPLVSLLRLSALVVIALALALPPATAGATDSAWRGQYFANQVLSGTPALERSDADLNFNWGWGSPDPTLPADHFSARWTRSVDFPAGQYRFSVSADDGARLYVDGQPLIDQWRITAPITYTSSISLTAGTHALRVEYFENTERALVHVWWDQGTLIPVNSSAWQPPDHPGAWQGTYYNNVSLSGDPAFRRDDAFVYFDWGTGGPGGGLGGQNYSVRWDRVLQFDGGHYKFKVTADDGVRVWFDWAAIIDQWHDSTGQTYTVEKDVSAGKHEIVLEYYQRGDTAQVKFEWQDTRQTWVGNLITCMRPSQSWIKIYRLAPNNIWEDLQPAGYGPMAQNGELKLFGLPISPLYGWDGQPYKVELWEDGKMVRTEGDVLAGQKALVMLSDQTIQTSWPCGANIPQP
jgi:PA14 domain